MTLEADPEALKAWEPVVVKSVIAFREQLLSTADDLGLVWASLVDCVSRYLPIVDGSPKRRIPTWIDVEPNIAQSCSRL